MTRTALVTGGSGFLGGHLVESLVGDGWRVRVLDWEQPLSNSGVEWVRGDTRDAEVTRSAASGVEVLFHLASTVGVGRLLDDPVEAIDVVVNGTLSSLEAAAQAGASLVHVSSSEVYGTNADLPWTETGTRNLGSALVDRWSYAAAKATAEHVVLAGAPTRGVAATVIRPFNIYGPRQEPRFVVPMMLRAALAGDPIEVSGDGRQTRCFTYVSDAVTALMAAGAKPGLGPLFVVGSAEETEILTLAHTIRALVGSESEIVFSCPSDRVADGFEDILRRLPDTARARTLLGWEPSVTLLDGLARTVGWHQGDIRPVDVSVRPA